MSEPASEQKGPSPASALKPSLASEPHGTPLPPGGSSQWGASDFPKIRGCGDRKRGSLCSTLAAPGRKPTDTFISSTGPASSRVFWEQTRLILVFGVARCWADSGPFTQLETARPRVVSRTASPGSRTACGLGWAPPAPQLGHILRLPGPSGSKKVLQGRPAPSPHAPPGASHQTLKVKVQPLGICLFCFLIFR